MATLRRETHGEPGRSARYRLIHRTFGLGGELRAGFRAGDTCWGLVALLRGHDEPDFSAKEIAFAARVGPHIGHGLRDALLREQAAAGVPARAPGVIVLGPDGSVRSLTDQASFWLEQFPPELEPLRLALYDLTAREREVARLLIRGLTNDGIARALWISRYTVKDHVKAVYAKLRVTSRAELSAKVFHEHIAPGLDGQQVRQFGGAELAGRTSPKYHTARI